jgi:hypothetical protein
VRSLGLLINHGAQQLTTAFPLLTRPRSTRPVTPDFHHAHPSKRPSRCLLRLPPSAPRRSLPPARPLRHHRRRPPQLLPPALMYQLPLKSQARPLTRASRQILNPRCPLRLPRQRPQPHRPTALKDKLPLPCRLPLRWQRPSPLLPAIPLPHQACPHQTRLQMSHFFLQRRQPRRGRE